MYFIKVAIATIFIIVFISSILSTNSTDNNDIRHNFHISNQYSFVTNNKYAICALTKSASLIKWKWLKELNDYNFDVYILEDIDKNLIRVDKDNSTIVSVSNDLSHKYGYSNANLSPNVVWAWDKAIFYFTKVSKKYDFIWFIEYDIYITSLKSFLNVHNTGMNKHADLIVKDNIKVDSHWGRINHRIELFKIDRPWYHSLVCAIGISKTLLLDIEKYAKTNHKLEFIEVLFNTIAFHKDYDIYKPKEMQTIQYNDQRHFINCRNIVKNSDFWYHPVKNQAEFLSDCHIK